MRLWQWLRRLPGRAERSSTNDPRVRTDGGDEDGTESDGEAGGGNGSDAVENDEVDDRESDGTSGIDGATVDVTEAGEAEPADPKWEKPDVEDIPEFEIGADESAGGGSTGTAPSETTDHGDGGADHGDVDAGHGDVGDPTAGRPNAARSPEQSRIKREGTEGYVAALELCARLPEDVRLPEQAADLVPAAVEAELEDDVQGFAASQFDNPTPHVDELSFVEVDDEIWLRIRLGIRPEAFDDLDPEAIRDHALQELEGLV